MRVYCGLRRIHVYRIFYVPLKFSARTMTTINGDLNNTSAERPKNEIAVDSTYRYRSLALSPVQDDPAIRQSYRPFLLDDTVSANDWVAQLELSTALKMVDTDVFQKGDGDRLRVLVLHGSMRKR